MNRDPAPKTAAGDAFDTGRLEQGGSATVTVTEHGTFDYRRAYGPVGARVAFYRRADGYLARARPSIAPSSNPTGLSAPEGTARPGGG